jgi:hypothetical protein
MRVPVTRTKDAPGKEPKWEAYKGGLVAKFEDKSPASAEQAVIFICQIPHGYKEGTDIQPHVHWIGEDTTAGDVVWKLTYSWANVHDPMPAEAAIYVTAPNVTAQADVQQASDFPIISGVGKEISSILICTLSRNSTNAADTFNGKDAFLLEIDLHFLRDTCGSAVKYSKT